MSVVNAETMTVIIPCLNEEHNIRATVESVLSVAATLDLRTELHLIDDGSTDNTRAVMESICAEVDGCTTFANETNLGVGRSVLDAYSRLPADHWATVAPGDNEIIFDSIRNHLAIRHDYDVILGYLQNPIVRPFVRRMASAAFTQSVSALYGYNYQYLNGLKLYRVSAFKGIDVVSGGHGFNAELLAKAQLRNPHLRVGEAPFLARGRATGWSKAFSTRNVTRSMRELYVGYASVIKYRDNVISGGSD